jgi:hypothetical protein
VNVDCYLTLVNSSKGVAELLLWVMVDYDSLRTAELSEKLIALKKLSIRVLLWNSNHIEQGVLDYPKLKKFLDHCFLTGP